MNKTSKLVALIAIALLITLSGCNLAASKKPEATATPSELDFMTSVPASTYAAQTEQAKSANVATATPEGPGGGGDQAGGGVEPTATSAVQAEQQQVQQAQAARPIPTLERPSTYTLQKGEWPICIARRYDVNLSDLFSLNGMNMESRPAVGTVLKMPTGGNWNSAHGSRALHEGSSYTVASGDTVYTIACYFGDVSPEAILAANGLGGPGDVKAGMKLTIP
ncbi:MAG: LysM peptidoglycan-binding domain-containing protein [Anaerolineaceae bacterium]|nr:LysM peptidoglycan-binding domain-containing protein [Anaerolineaceae bacterium]